MLLTFRRKAPIVTQDELFAMLDEHKEQTKDIQPGNPEWIVKEGKWEALTGSILSIKTYYLINGKFPTRRKFISILHENLNKEKKMLETAPNEIAKNLREASVAMYQTLIDKYAK